MLKLLPLPKYIKNHKTDAIEWQVQRWFNETPKNDPHAKVKLIDRISVLLSLIKKKPLQTAYLEHIAKEHKLKPAELRDSLTVIMEDDENREDDDEYSDKNWFPLWLKESKEKQEELLRHGFAERTDKHNTGYWFQSEKSLVQRTNFVMKPLYHVYGVDNRRMLAINNGYNEAVVEIPSKNMLNPQAFLAALWDQGNYQQKEGFTNYHMVKINLKYGDMYPMAYELNNLGWQMNEGFFAFANMTYRPPEKDKDQGTLHEYNEYGVVQVGEMNYLSPSRSRANEKMRSTENPFENDLYLSYVKSPVSFSDWAILLGKVYGDHSYMAIAWSMATLFRDIVIKVTKIPHLYAYGPVGAGKSEYGESVNNLFFSGKDSKGDLYKPMNLNQGTDFAFWNRMERFYNCPNALNEFDEWAIDDNWFRGIKAAYDGEGRPKGMKEKNRSTMQKVNCTLILMGQYLGTRDDNSVLTRSIPLAFKVIPASERTDEQIKAFTELKNLEHKGINGILIEMMNLRPLFEKFFVESFTRFQRLLIEDLKSEGVNPPTRILKNVVCMIAATDLTSMRLKLPYSTDDFYTYAKNYVRHLTNLVSSTSGLSEFWSTVEYLFERGQIREGYEYEVKTVTSISITSEDKRTEVKPYLPEKTILFLRLESVHKLYLEVCAKTRKVGLNESTLKLYMKDQKWYEGWIKARRFKTTVNSCYAFDYNELDISILADRDEERPAERNEIVITGEITFDAQPVPGQELYKTNVKVYNYIKQQDGTNRTETTVYTCYFNTPDAPGQIVRAYKIQLLGLLEEKQSGNNVIRNIDVTDFEARPNHQPFERDLISEKTAAQMRRKSEEDPEF